MGPFSTVNEINLQHEINELRRENYALTQRLYSRWMPSEPIVMDKAPATLTLPLAADIQTAEEKGSLAVHARVHTTRPFGLSYYMNPGLLTVADAAQVLGHMHEEFVRKLAKFGRDQKEAA